MGELYGVLVFTEWSYSLTSVMCWPPAVHLLTAPFVSHQQPDDLAMTRNPGQPGIYKPGMVSEPLPSSLQRASQNLCNSHPLSPLIDSEMDPCYESKWWVSHGFLHLAWANLYSAPLGTLCPCLPKDGVNKFERKKKIINFHSPQILPSSWCSTGTLLCLWLSGPSEMPHILLVIIYKLTEILKNTY